MSKRLIKGISIVAGISLLMGLAMGSLALAAEKELTPLEWTGLSWKDKIEAKTVVIRDMDLAPWTEEKNLPTDTMTVSEMIHSGDVWTPFTWYNLALFETLHPEVYVEPVSFSAWNTDSLQTLLAMMAAGNAPSYFSVRGQDVAVTQGYAADITDIVEDWNQTVNLKENYWGLWKRGFWYEGRCYGIPRGKSGVPGFYYRRDWFEAAGIFGESGEPEPPKNWTWSDLREIARKISDPKKNRWGMGYRLIRALNFTDELVSLYATTMGYPVTSLSLGESWVIPDKSGEYTWKFDYIPQIAEGIKFFHDMRWEDNTILYGPISGAGQDDDFYTQDARIGMWYYQAMVMVPVDSIGRPHIFDPDLLSKDVEGVFLPPTSQYDIKLNGVSSSGRYFDPTITKEQLKAAFDWVVFNELGEGYKLWLETEARLAAGGIPLGGGTWWCYYGTPYEVDLSGWVETAFDKAGEQVPKQFFEQRELGLKLPSIPSPIDYGLRIDPGALTILVEMRNGLLLQEKLTMDDIKAEMEKTAEKINRKILNYKVEGDQEKFKAYVAALDEFYKENFPKWYNSKEYKVYMEEYWKV